ncbi:MAG: von Willebrand factor type A domain-containing protein [Cyclobacteriaceae bacterium]
MMKLKWILLLISAIVLAGYSTKNLRTVSGTVYKADGVHAIEKVQVSVKHTDIATTTDAKGHYTLEVPSDQSILVFSKTGFKTVEERVNNRSVINIEMKTNQEADTIIVYEEVMIETEADYNMSQIYNSTAEKRAKAIGNTLSSPAITRSGIVSDHTFPIIKSSSEEYAEITESGFLRPSKTPLSTFSIDVDAASYSNVRRFLNNGQMPPADAVRVEEMINYFSYDYPQPKGNDPFSVTTEIAPAPWNSQHQLVHVGIQGEKIDTEDLPASNLVFLLDVSGSMNRVNKLPLLKSAFQLLVAQLRPEDKVSIVVYAGAAGMVLEPTSGDNKSKILNAFKNLSAGGSTAGGAGIELAYATAKEHFIKGGNNRIILATDGDFNVGASSDKAMEDLIEEKRNDGIYLTVLGFGMGNYKDSKMEILADKGNGNYAYIDNIQEAKKVLVSEFGGTMYTIAKDVKIQVEFNPQNVQAYRLIGYENRALNDEDFNNDKKDAGELGAGHTVTALYEIIPIGVESSLVSVDPLKYQIDKNSSQNGFSDELMTVKLRYKKPEGNEKSKLITKTIMQTSGSKVKPGENFRWSAAVAAYGMLLRDSEYINEMSYQEVVDLARSARGTDSEGYRAEFIRLVTSSMLLARSE